MRRTEQRQGLRMLKLRDVLSRWEGAELSQLEAAELLGMSERTFRRWSRRFEEAGEAGLMDRRLGRRSGRAVLDATLEEVERLYRELRWVHGEALPRALAQRAPVRLGLHLDQDVSARPRAAGEGGAAWRAPTQASVPAAGRDDAASGRVTP